jgi:hypothetical protein
VELQHGEARAEYGTHLIKNLAEAIVPLYGNTYSKRNLDYYKKFYLTFPDLEIVNTRVHNLDWSHFRRDYYVQIRIIPLHFILYCMIVSRFLLLNICHIYLKKKSCAKR